MPVVEHSAHILNNEITKVTKAVLRCWKSMWTVHTTICVTQGHALPQQNV